MTPPHGLDAIVERYGNPMDYLDRKATWENFTLKTRNIPAIPYAYGPATITRIRAHSLVIEFIVQAMQTAIMAGVPPARMAYGGCYAWRPMRRAAKLSTHTWGIAIDLDPAHNPLGRRWKDDGIMLDPRIIEAFESLGFQWGGRWKRPDPQHFQYATGY